uniref:Uncharacterized protein n=1 Tax=Strigamia maritima TaxID=126957 RepID=T1J1W6_STRMM
MGNDEKYCILQHNQQVIGFSCVVKGDLLITNADLFYYNTQKEEFRLNRTEKCEIKMKSGKFQLEKTQCNVVKDISLGIQVPVVTIKLFSKQNSYLYSLILDYTRKKGSQLRSYHHFPFSSDGNTKLIIRDGPSFLCSNHNRLKLVYYNSVEYKTHQILPEYVGNFVLFNESNSSLYFIDGENGFLMSFSLETKELVNHGALIDDFTSKYAERVDVVNVEFDLNDLKGKKVVYFCCDSELMKFQNGQLVKKTFLPLNGKIADIYLYKHFSCDFLMILCEDGTLSAVKNDNFEVVKRWDNVDRIGIDDVMATGNKCVLIQFKSLVTHVLYNLNEKSVVTDILDVFYPKENIVNKNDEKMSVAAKAIENKLRVGELMLEDAQSRFNEKEECINQGISRMQELSANGDINSTPVNSHIIVIISPENYSMEIEQKESKLPLKVLELNGKIHKEFWLIRLKIENQSNKTLGNFTLHLVSSDNPIQFSVKFFRDEIFGDQNFGLNNLFVFKDYFSAVSPIIKRDDTMELIAAIHLTQPIFENLVVAVQVSAIFEIISEEKEIIPRMQLCGSLIYTFECLTSNSQQIFDIWALSTTKHSLTLEIHSSETNLSSIRQLLRDNLPIEHSELDSILYFRNFSHPLTNVAIQVSSKMADYETRIRIYYNTDTEIILLLHLMYSKLPPDMIITPFTGDLKALTNILKTSLQEELDIIREIISSRANSSPLETEIPMELDEKSPKESLKRLRKAFTARQKWLKQSKNGKIEYKMYKKLKNRLDQIEFKTDLNVGLFSPVNVSYYK